MSAEPGPRRAPLSDHLANERTHLAYVRTAISLLGFGIAVNKFSAFLSESSRSGATYRPLLHDTRLVGFGMVVAGFALILYASFRYRRLALAIDRGECPSNQRAVLIMSAILTAMAAVSMAWLFFG